MDAAKLKKGKRDPVTTGVSCKGLQPCGSVLNHHIVGISASAGGLEAFN